MQMRRDQQTRHTEQTKKNVRNNNPESLKFEHPVFLRFFAAS